MTRLTDRQIAEEFLRLYSPGQQVDTQYVELMEPMVHAARMAEPRINSGVHLFDYSNICDEDDDFDSFYGKDYFSEGKPMHYAVFFGDKLEYFGTDSKVAWSLVEASSSARLEKLDSPDDLLEILKSLNPGESPWLQLIGELQNFGITKEKGLAWLQGFQEEGNETVNVVKDYARPALGLLGDVIVTLGMSIKDIGDETE